MSISALSSQLQSKLATIDALQDKKITASEAKELGLSNSELSQIKAAGFEIDESISLEDDTKTNAAQTTETAKTETTTQTAGSRITMPAETIDEAATAKVKQEILQAREEYETAKAESEQLASKIDKKEDEYDALQSQLKKAVSNVEDAAINASEEVAIEVNKVRQRAQEEGWDETRTQQELSKIGIPSISGEQRTLESVGLEVADLAKVITQLSDLYAAQADTVDMLAQRWGGFLEVDLESVCVDMTGKVVVNERGAEGPEVSGADGVSAADMQKFASMTNEQLTAYLTSDAGKDLMTAMQGMAGEGVNLSAENCTAILKNLLAEQDKSTGETAKFGTQFADKLQVNEVNGVSKEDLQAAIGKVEQEAKKSCDPYVINIDGVEYTMILDNGDGKWDTNDILGINDSKDNLFEALKGLESDGDVSSLTGDELAKAGIRLVAKDKNGKLAVDDKSKDFDLSKIKSIDMTNLANSTDNDGNVGTFGHFDMTLTDGRTIKGAETFEEMSTLKKLFGAVKNFFNNLGNVASDIISKLMVDADDKAWYSEGIKEKVSAYTKYTDKSVTNAIEGSDAVLDETNQAKIDAEFEYKMPEAPDEEAKAQAQAQEQANVEAQEQEEAKKKKQQQANA